jgi:hypothetical protein
MRQTRPTRRGWAARTGGGGEFISIKQNALSRTKMPPNRFLLRTAVLSTHGPNLTQQKSSRCGPYCKPKNCFISAHLTHQPNSTQSGPVGGARQIASSPAVQAVRSTTDSGKRRRLVSSRLFPLSPCAVALWLARCLRSCSSILVSSSLAAAAGGRIEGREDDGHRHPDAC